MSLWPAIRAAKDGVFHADHLLITVNGTAVPDPFGPGFAADLGRELDRVAEGLYYWQPIGYPAATFPMRPSIEAGRQAVNLQIDNNPHRKIAMSGYSQGALVVNGVWRDDILNPDGRLHHRLGDVLAIINYGDPMRCPGVANGNKYAGQPMPKKLSGHTTGGIAGPGCLTKAETPDFLLSFANDGDLYAAAPVGDNPWEQETEVGHNETMIYEAVMDFDGEDIMALMKEFVEILSMPLTQVIPLVQAIWNGLTFLGQGPRAPHWTYDIRPGVRYLIERAIEVPAIVS